MKLHAHVLTAFFMALALVRPALSQSICDKGQVIDFSCNTKHGKIIAICRAPSPDTNFYFQYRYGRPGKLELVYPREDLKEGGIPIHQSVYGPKIDYEMWFNIGKYHYRFYNSIKEIDGRNQTSNIGGEGRYETTNAGVIVWRDGWEKKRLFRASLIKS